MDDNLMPDLRCEEYEALKESIQQVGVLIPIEVTDDDRIIDGHHRLQVCEELGIECPRCPPRHVESEEDFETLVLAFNLARRHMGPISWARFFRRLCEIRGARLGSGKGDPSGKAASVATLAKELGVAPRTARERLQVEEATKDDPVLAGQVDRGEVGRKDALTIVRREEKRKQRPARTPDDEIIMTRVAQIRAALHKARNTIAELSQWLYMVPEEERRHIMADVRDVRRVMAYFPADEPEG